ncbi:hypothetical protein GCM10010331_45500 [Streptomyces xanthochromogenes]|uniref:hypothetical protein n=1 Tax=Streptomyces xanthochromogenes TaxID=67384 RepID=UPI00167B0D82|nr:hypothetical protein [Streptomyces xanthochromogenes]GHB52756.1 hypothetical protein GCM10010331_45500 [Streptomyces xanthochromogenes]
MDYAPRPWSSSREQQVDDMLQALSAPVHQGTWCPPKVVFGTHGTHPSVPTLDDALAVDSTYPPPQTETRHGR